MSNNEYPEYERAAILKRENLFTCIRCRQLCRVRQNGLCFMCIGLRNDLQRKAEAILNKEHANDRTEPDSDAG